MRARRAFQASPKTTPHERPSVAAASYCENDGGRSHGRNFQGMGPPAAVHGPYAFSRRTDNGGRLAAAPVQLDYGVPSP